MNPDELLQMLGSLFSPASAEAVGPTFEQRQQLEAQKLVQQLQLMQEKARIADEQRQNDALRQAQTAKIQATTPQASSQDSLLQLLGGDQYQPEGSSIFAYGGGVQPTMESSNDRIRLILDALMQGEAPPGQDPNIGPQTQQDFTPISPQPGQTFGLKGYEQEGFGFNPQTGAFTNIGVPGGPSPETRKPTTLPAQNIAMERANLASIIKANYPKLPDSELTKLLDAQFPKEPATKPVPIEKLSKLFKYNPETNDFIAAPGNLTEKQMIDEGYRTYDEKIRSKVGELSDVKLAFQQFKSAINDIRDKSAIELKTSELTGGNFGGSEGAVYKKDSINFTTIFDKFLGGVRGAASPQMQEIRSKVLPSIISSGKVSDRLMKDLEELIDAMSQERINTSLGSNVALNINALNAKADKVLASAGMGGGRAGTKVGGIAAQDATPLKAIPAGAVDIHRTSNGKPVYRLPNGKLWVE